MIKVVVADDEEKVCQLICGLVDWESVGMELVGVAHNGLQVLELIESKEPDLVITDIRMPGCDGLEMIRNARELSKELDFIIVSGHRHFEYAQSALKYGVSDYLLKPIKKQELLDALIHTSERYAQRSGRLSDEQQWRLRLQNDIDKLRSGLFTELLLSKAQTSPPTELERINENYHFHFAEGLFQVFIAKTDYTNEAIHERGRKLFEDKLVQILHNALKAFCFDMELCIVGSRTYGVLNYAADNKKAVRRALKSALDELLVQKDLFPKLAVTIGTGAPVACVTDLFVSAQGASAAVAQRLLLGTGQLIEPPAAAPVPIQSKDALLGDFSRGLEAALEVLDLEKAEAAVQLLEEKSLKQGAFCGEELLELATDACGIYRMLLRKHPYNEGNMEGVYETFCQQADLCRRAEELFALLCRTVGQSLKSIVEAKRQEETKPIRLAKQYIQQNYCSPISLEEVSQIAGFNASYFSSLFKKETGQNFSEYISAVRMNKAKELLKETNSSIACICEEVGYCDLKHFTKSFKKFAGVGPNEYRKLYA